MRETGARGRSHREVNMRFRDEVIASYLNEEWRTPLDVHRLLGSRDAVADIAYALERLARAGKIEARHEATMVPKFFRDKSGPPVLCIDFYRKLQKWPKSSSMGKLPTTVTDTRQQPARKKPAPRPQGCAFDPAATHTGR
jgi:hypothetical protein